MTSQLNHNCQVSQAVHVAPQEPGQFSEHLWSPSWYSYLLWQAGETNLILLNMHCISLRGHFRKTREIHYRWRKIEKRKKPSTRESQTHLHPITRRDLYHCAATAFRTYFSHSFLCSQLVAVTFIFKKSPSAGGILQIFLRSFSPRTNKFCTFYVKDFNTDLDGWHLGCRSKHEFKSCHCSLTCNNSSMVF